MSEEKNIPEDQSTGGRLHAGKVATESTGESFSPKQETTKPIEEEIQPKPEAESAILNQKSEYNNMEVHHHGMYKMLFYTFKNYSFILKVTG